MADQPNSEALDPHSPDALWHLGEQAAIKRHWKEAADYLNEFASLASDGVRCWQRCFCGATNVLAGNYEAAISLLSDLLENEYFPLADERSEYIETTGECPAEYLWGIDLTTPPWELLEEGKPLAMTGFIFADALCWRGRALLEQGQPDKALPDFTEAARHLTELVKAECGEYPDFAIFDGPDDCARLTDLSFLWPTYWAGRCHVAKGDFDERLDANTDYEQAISLFEDVQSAAAAYISRYQSFPEWMCREHCFHWSGVVFEALGEAQKAIESYSEAIWINPSSWETFYHRGMLHRSLAQYDEKQLTNAKAKTNTAKEEADGDQDDGKDMNVRKGVKDTVEAIWLNPQYLPAYLELSRLLVFDKELTSSYFRPHHVFWANEYGETGRFLVEAVTTASSDVLGCLQWALGEHGPDVTCAGLSMLVDRVKTSAAWYFLLGVAQYEYAKYEAAETSFQSALACDPSVVAARYGLAATYRAIHEYAKAEQATESANRMRSEICENRWRLKPEEESSAVVEFRVMAEDGLPQAAAIFGHSWAVDVTSGLKHLPIAVMAPFPAVLYSLAFSRSGNYLAAGYVCGRVGVLDIATGAVVKYIASEAEAPATVAFSPDNQFLAVGCGDTVSLLKMAQNGHRHIATLKHDAEIADVYISQDGLRLGVEVEDNDRPLWIWNLRTMTVERILSSGFRDRLQVGLASVAEHGEVSGAAWFALTTSEEGHLAVFRELRTWHLGHGEQYVHAYKQPADGEQLVHCHSSHLALGRFAVSLEGAFEGVVGVEIDMTEYDKADTIDWAIEMHVSAVNGVHCLEEEWGGSTLGKGRLCSPMPFSSDGRFLATFDKRSVGTTAEAERKNDGCCRIWRLDDRRAVEIPVTIQSERRDGNWAVPSLGATGRVPVAFSPCSNLVAVASEGSQIGIWDLRRLFGEPAS